MMNENIFFNTDGNVGIGTTNQSESITLMSTPTGRSPLMARFIDSDNNKVGDKLSIGDFVVYNGIKSEIVHKDRNGYLANSPNYLGAAKLDEMDIEAFLIVEFLGLKIGDLVIWINYDEEFDVVKQLKDL